MLAAGAIGAVAMFALQWWDAVLRYPMNHGGRPLNAWPTFGLATFEVAVLAAAFVGFVAMLIGGGLPRPHHPFFASPHTGPASDDLFYLSLPMSAGYERPWLETIPGALERVRGAGMSGRTRLLPLLGLAVLAGCGDDDLARQPKYDTYAPASPWDDGASARPLVPGTVSREAPARQAALATPPTMDMALVERGPRALRDLLRRPATA